MKVSHLVNTLLFLLILFGFFFFFLLSPDQETTVAERRKLAQFPQLSPQTVLDGSFFQNFDKYTTDQFPLRDNFRTVGALVRKNLLLQKDVNGLYLQNGVVFKTDYPLVEKNIDRFVEKTNEICNQMIAGKAANYWVSVIPDKSFFDTSDHLKTDPREIAAHFAENLEAGEYIDIFPGLTLDSYYKTDTHWSQDKLFPVIKIFADKMRFSPPNQSDYTLEERAPFYGVYWGQSALNPPPDTLRYMTNAVTEAATVENTDKPAVTSVYDLDAFASEDGYNLFLSGGTPLTRITSPKARTDKELVIFRDSFGSSIAPLFLEEYRTVTLVDLRYFSTALLEKQVDFTGKDVLVLYSALILNSNIILK